MIKHWWKLSSDLAFAGMEAQRVIGLRLTKLAKGGPAAKRETRRMMVEKIAASTEAFAALASGRSPDSIVRRIAPSCGQTKSVSARDAETLRR